MIDILSKLSQADLKELRSILYKTADKSYEESHVCLIEQEVYEKTISTIFIVEELLDD